MRGLVSVVIPVRNGARYLSEAIESVLSQKPFGQPPSALEVIVVDNGSTDRSRAVAESFGPPVRLIVEAEPGAARARNSGVASAQGEFLAFLDADDLWQPGKIERQLGALQAREDLDMVFTYGENFLSPELTEDQRRSVEFLAGVGPLIMPSAMLARRESFLKAGPLPLLREGEFIAWYGIALSKGLLSDVIPEPLVRRRVHLTNSTRVAPNQPDLLRAAKMVLDHRRVSRGPAQ